MAGIEWVLRGFLRTAEVLRPPGILRASVSPRRHRGRSRSMLRTLCSQLLPVPKSQRCDALWADPASDPGGRESTPAPRARQRAGERSGALRFTPGSGGPAALHPPRCSAAPRSPGPRRRRCCAVSRSPPRSALRPPLRASLPPTSPRVAAPGRVRVPVSPGHPPDPRVPRRALAGLVSARRAPLPRGGVPRAGAPAEKLRRGGGQGRGRRPTCGPRGGGRRSGAGAPGRALGRRGAGKPEHPRAGLGGAQVGSPAPARLPPASRGPSLPLPPTKLHPAHPAPVHSASAAGHPRVPQRRTESLPRASPETRSHLPRGSSQPPAAPSPPACREATPVQARPGAHSPARTAWSEAGGARGTRACS